ncbi:MAG TPA: glycosyltransferase family 4 protein, partial [Anaerolineales bacterium]|nr:glycosyltransferase family 4 protein [Anaerolineales bacterium]
MKIGFVIYGSLDTVSGGYLYDRKLVEYLRAQGDQVEIISLPWRNYASHLTDNFRFRLPPNLDILIQDELNHPSLIAANAGRHPYPIVSLVHHLRCSELRPAWQNWLYRIVEKKYLQSVDGFIFNSKTTERVVSRLLDSSKPSVVAYPPTDRFGDGITEKEIIERAKSDELRILFLGNVIYRKGLHTVLEALRRVGRDIISSYRLDVVGGLTAEPKYAEDIKKFVMVNGLSSIVTFHGTLDEEPLREKLKQAHVLVVPSSYEGFGIVYLEGMCFGLPAIGTSAGAAGEIITHGENGYLIEPNDAETLANHLRELGRNRESLVRLSLNAVKRYKSQPRWEETAKSIREF